MLLAKIDQRISPHLYNLSEKENECRCRSTEQTPGIRRLCHLSFRTQKSAGRDAF